MAYFFLSVFRFKYKQEYEEFKLKLTFTEIALSVLCMLASHKYDNILIS
jgi:hypothetical protein